MVWDFPSLKYLPFPLNNDKLPIILWAITFSLHRWWTITSPRYFMGYINKDCLYRCTIILILLWHYRIINKVMCFFFVFCLFCFVFLQSAIEKLTHDYLNLFHFPPLIKVRFFFSTENVLFYWYMHLPHPHLDLPMSGTVVWREI